MPLPFWCLNSQPCSPPFQFSLKHSTTVPLQLCSYWLRKCHNLEEWIFAYTAIGFRNEFETIAEAVGAAAFTPHLEPPPRLPRAIVRTKNEPRAGVGAAHPVRIERRDERRDHGSCGHRRIGKIVNRYGPSFALLPRPLALAPERTQAASRTSWFRL